jgi:hypothetical protein
LIERDLREFKAGAEKESGAQFYPNPKGFLFAMEVKVDSSGNLSFP